MFFVWAVLTRPALSAPPATPTAASVASATPVASGRAGTAAQNRGSDVDLPGASGGSVNVRGYTRKDGTHVNGYTRRK